MFSLFKQLQLCPFLLFFLCFKPVFPKWWVILVVDGWSQFCQILVLQNPSALERTYLRSYKMWRWISGLCKKHSDIVENSWSLWQQRWIAVLKLWNMFESFRPTGIKYLMRSEPQIQLRLEVCVWNAACPSVMYVTVSVHGVKVYFKGFVNIYVYY